MEVEKSVGRIGRKARGMKVTVGFPELPPLDDWQSNGEVVDAIFVLSSTYTSVCVLRARSIFKPLYSKHFISFFADWRWLCDINYTGGCRVYHPTKVSRKPPSNETNLGIFCKIHAKKE